MCDTGKARKGIDKCSKLKKMSTSNVILVVIVTEPLYAINKYIQRHT